MKKVYVVLLVVISLFLVSCTGLFNNEIKVGDVLKINVNVENPTDPYLTRTASNPFFNLIDNKDYFFGIDGLTAAIDIDGDLVQANHIAVYNDFTVVSYNYANGMKGAIQIIDWSDKSFTNVLFDNANINSVHVDESGIVSFVGFTIRNQMGYTFINKFDLNVALNTTAIANTRVIYIQTEVSGDDETVVATAVEKIGTNYYVSLADTPGRIIKINEAFALTSMDFELVDYVKDLKTDGTNLFALSLNETDGTLYELDANLDEVTTYEINGTANKEAKASLALFGDYAAYSREADGFDVIKLEAEEVAVNYALGLVNGLSYEDGKLFVNYSKTNEIGVKVYNDDIEIISERFFNEFDEGVLSGVDLNEASSNFVIYNPTTGYVFAATGQTGVFAYEFISQNEVVGAKGTDDFKYLKLATEDDKAIEVVMDFVLVDADYTVNIFQYPSAADTDDDIWVDYTTRFAANDDGVLKDIFTEAGRVSYKTEVKFLGLHLAKDSTDYTNLEPVATSKLSLSYNATANNGKGEITVYDGETLVMAIRAYYQNADLIDIFDLTIIE